MQEHILIVDDDREIRRLLSEYLRQNGYRTTAAPDGRSALAALPDQRIDLVVLDLMLPGIDGLEVCRWIRAGSRVPIIMLTAKGEETDRIIGLEMGADDYLPKPFNPRELLARIRSVLRRAESAGADSGSSPAPLRFADWRLDPNRRQLIDADGRVVELSGSEYDLLRVLVTRPNRILSRDQLLDLTRGRDAAPFDRSIDMQVSRLRKRLGDHEQKLIKTVRGLGYVFAAEVEPER
ncbi:MAG: response regulator transcription factor [Pseudomonadota bacterium]|nr:response regulator transcription factor [Pseudomonadota bacterium]